MRFATASAALVASASSAVAIGSAIIVNHCPYDVNVQSVSNTPGPSQRLSANGGQYSEPFRVNPNGGGISIKVSKPDSNGPVSQFEYTYNPPSNPYPGVFWDLSLIDGNIFKDTMVALIPKILDSSSPGGSCSNVNCAGGTVCTDAYNNPWENAATHSCPANTDLTYYLCSDGTSKPAASPAPSPAPAPAPAASPAPSPEPAPKPAPEPASSPAPVPVAADQLIASPAPSPSPAPAPAPAAPAPVPVAAPAPAAAASHPFALAWTEGDERIGEIQIGNHNNKRQSHLEAHNRIRRMHHARSM